MPHLKPALAGAILALATTGPAAKPALARGPAASLCRAKEAQTFSCPVGRKIVSICGEGAGAIYRFGRPGRVEMEARGPTTAQIGYSGGGEAQVAFAGQGYSYVVYDRTVRTRFTPDGRHDPAFSQGLLVVKGAHVVADRPCRGDGAGFASKGLEGMAAGPAVNH